MHATSTEYTFKWNTSKQIVKIIYDVVFDYLIIVLDENYIVFDIISSDKLSQIKWNI